MPERMSSKIRRYCEARGVTLPIGFERRPASRYAIIEETNPPKLVARTWFNQSDVVYYLERLMDDTPRRILDFKEGVELTYDGGKRLRRAGRFK